MQFLKDRLNGSLLGLAIGDALGAPVEFVKLLKPIYEEWTKEYLENSLSKLAYIQSGDTLPKSLRQRKYEELRAIAKNEITEILMIIVIMVAREILEVIL